MNDTPYDSVPYQTHPFPQAHPDRLAVLARLFGLHPRALEHCRVLELGCGDGNNLIPIALALPQAELTGIDLSGSAISKGQTLINRLGLKNITLLHKDIKDLGEEMGAFDYILAHGIYSWVAPDIQDKLLSVCKNNLAPEGVAYVSYNIYPGWHMRGMVREIVQFHTDHFPDPEQKAAQARSILKFIAEAVPPEKAGYRRVLAEELDLIMRVHTDYIYHGQLGAINQPLYFHEFMAHAARHGLRFLAEANFFEMQDMFLAPDAKDLLRRIAGDNIIVMEQFLDFIKGRQFRQTLLCHEAVTPNRRLHPEAMQSFFFSCSALPMNQAGEKLKGSIQELMRREDLTFRTRGGSAINTDVPVARAAFLHLEKVFPARVPFQALLKTVQKHLDEAARAEGKDTDARRSDEGAEELCNMLLAAFSGNIVGLHVHAPPFASTPGERPIASPLVRLQVQHTSRVTNLCHHIIELENTYGPLLLPLLDGTRDRKAIRADMVKLIRSHDVPLHDTPASEKSTAELMEEIDQELAHCARYALLVA